VVVQSVAHILRTAVAALALPPPAAAPVVGSAAVTTSAPAGSLRAVTTHRRPRRLPRCSTLLPLAVCGRDFLR
jgi:hypothetical protein